MLTLLFINMTSCVENNSIRIDKDILNGWGLEESIAIEIKDTIDFPSDIFFYIRNNNDYPFSNIFLISSIQNNNYVISDTIEYYFENNETKWYEIKPSGIKNNKILLKKDLKIDEGNVIVKLKHSIRYLDSIAPLTKLDGILDVGLIVEKSFLDEKK